MEDMKRRLVVLGAGESGTGAAILAKDKGFDVFLSDSGHISPRYRAVLEAEGIEFEEGTHTMARILAADEVVKSPGIPVDVPVMAAVLAKHIPVVSGIEFATRRYYLFSMSELPTILILKTAPVKSTRPPLPSSRFQKMTETWWSQTSA